jgi:hypothetical protein
MTDNPLVELAQKAGAEVAPTDYYGWAKLVVDPQLRPLDYDPARWRGFVERARSQVDDGSLAAAVKVAGAGLSDSEHAQLAFYLITEIQNEYGADADQLSATTFDKGDYCGGDQDVITNGYDALPRLLGNGLQIVLNTAASGVELRPDSVIVRSKDRSFEGSAAIVTVPLGVLKSGAITFDPPLPEEHARAVNALGVGVLSKSFFRFDRRTWNVDNAFYQYLSVEDDLWSQWFTLPSATGPIVLAFNAGEHGRFVESSPPPDLIASALPVARRIFGSDISLTEVRTSNWAQDPYARGAYSFHAPGSGLDDRRRLQQPIGDRLYLAG